MVLTAAQDKDASPHVTVLRIQGPLCFANAARTKERILNLKVLPFSALHMLTTNIAPVGMFELVNIAPAPL